MSSVLKCELWDGNYTSDLPKYVLFFFLPPRASFVPLIANRFWVCSSWCTLESIPFPHFPKWFHQEKQIISVRELSGQIVYLLFLLHLKPREVIHVTATITDASLPLPCRISCTHILHSDCIYDFNIYPCSTWLWCSERNHSGLDFVWRQHMLHGFSVSVLSVMLMLCLCGVVAFSAAVMISVTHVCCYFNNYSWAQRKSKQEKIDKPRDCCCQKRVKSLGGDY